MSTAPAPHPARDWIDVSVPVSEALVVWPGDPELHVEVVSDVGEGDPATVRRLEMSSHTGTHIDAPAHFLPGGPTLDALDPEVFNGPARVVHVDSERAIEPADLLELDLERGARVLFRTRNSRRAWWHEAFDEDFVALSVEAARWLVERGVRLVGVDYLSVSCFHDDPAGVHCALLEADIGILEGLDLTRVQPGRYELRCLPMRIAGGDGAPARAMLRPLAEDGDDD